MIQAHKTPSALIASLSRDIIANAAALRQGAGRGDGDRPAPSLAATAVDLVDIVEHRRRPGAMRAIEEVVTEPGMKTAARREPPILSKLARHDGRRLAVVAYASAAERVGAVRGVSIGPAAPGGGGAGIPDGGASTRVKYAATLRVARAVANRWRWSRASRSYVAGPDRAILTARRGGAATITATDLLDAIALEGLDMVAILKRAGWSGHSKQRRALTEAAEEIFEELADALGYGNRIARR